ncbi:MAG TPA: aminotransferase class III-fold pyridoxal phosphate-dependent enzyme, partial [Candidatus Tectomicrobia bacterium]
MHPQCLEWRKRGKQVLAGGPATLSKHWSRYPSPCTPSVLVRGQGASVWCADGIEYLDMVAGLGPILLGHNDSRVSAAVNAQIDQMTCSTLSTPLETEVAELLCAVVPGAEQVRFASNGADVTNAAIKLARHVTGKKHVVFCGYAGGHDSYLSTTEKRGGVLENLRDYNHQVPWRDFAALEAVLDQMADGLEPRDLAAIILEVPPEALAMPFTDTAATLQRYKASALGFGALFILDEVVTGWRMGVGGAQTYYGVQADLCTFSKAMGNGYPIAAITGPWDLMTAFEGGQCFLSTTFGASPIGLAAAKATIGSLVDDVTLLHQLWDYGQIAFLSTHDRITARGLPMTLRGNGSRWVLDFHDTEAASADAWR